MIDPELIQAFLGGAIVMLLLDHYVVVPWVASRVRRMQRVDRGSRGW